MASLGREADAGPDMADRLARARGAIARPSTALGLLLLLILGLLVLVPLVRLVGTTVADDGLAVWREVLTGRLSPNLFREPLANTLALGTAVALGSIVLGGGMAWLVVLTDAPGRRWLGVLASIPFILPSFAIALAWETIFRNDRIGGRPGVLQDLGVPIPDWLAWGFVPIAATLVAHYFSLAFVLIGASLASVNTELLEAAEMTGASRARVLRGITLPLVLPAVISAGLLCFAEGASNFAGPALLGLPVRFHTLSTRLYGSIQTGQVERGYVLAILLIVVAALVLGASSRLAGGRRSYATITGKGGRRQRQRLGAWRWPVFTAGFAVCAATTIVPALALLASSFSRRTGSLTAGVTPHYWIGESDSAFADGQPGILRNPQIIDAALNTVLLGTGVALVATALGLAIGYVVVRGRGRVPTTVGILGYVPFLIPGVAFGAIYIAQFSQSIGPLPALYGTFALLILAGAAYSLPFAAQAGRAAMSQVAGELEEAAVMAGAGFGRRLGRILVPLAARGLIAGAVLVFVSMVRDLALVVLLVTPTTPLLSVVTFRYASEGFAQLANAITIIIATISVVATLLARRLQGTAQPWLRED